MIETLNLTLIPFELAHFEAVLNDPQRLALMLGISIAEGWAAFPESLPYSYKYLKAHPEALGWWTYLFIHTKEKVLVGYGGFKGVADESGMVEIGYSIAPAWRTRGLATEAAQGLIDYAFSHPHIKMIDAHTLAETNPSTKVLKKVGMKFMAALPDPEQGQVWHWRLRREEYQKA
ncbi:MAG TPA: GNAT family N-acetyltransferase [Pyrinomonadaceae bacterium]|jgi:RimJ/RimL family protein N-acetyltransferase